MHLSILPLLWSVMAAAGFKPAVYFSTDYTIKATKKIIRFVLALPGIEPGLARPQRDVIPLDHSTCCCVAFLPKMVSVGM